jgi:hypothetical protein
MEDARRQELTRHGLEALLADLEACPGDWLTVYLPRRQAGLPPDTQPPPVNDLPEIQTLWLREVDALARELDSETGAVFFWSDARRVVVLPPFPLPETSCRTGCDTLPLRSLLAAPRKVGVVLVRLGRYAVGIFEGEHIVDSKSGHRFVKGRHRAGGQSAQRFVRIREKQAREMFEKACEEVKARFEPVERELDYVFLGGDRHTLAAFLKRCPYLQRLQDRTMKRLLPVARPGQSALESMPREILKSQVLFVEWPAS